jgi:cobalt-zinc-cadmium efflux system outer membrane protein
MKAAGMRFSLLCLALVAAFSLAPRDARAQAVPAAAELPQVLSLDEALRIFRTRGLDLLIAEAAVTSAEGATQIAGAVPNPVLGASWGLAFTYANQPSGSCPAGGALCANQLWTVDVSDSAALEDSLSGKRELRLKVTRNALASAKMSRVDAERTIAFQVKASYVQVAQATLAVKFAQEVAQSNAKILALFQTKLAAGAINEGDFARVETTKLESDQALDTALVTLRQSRVALAFLLGVRGSVPDFEVDTKVLDFTVPAAMAGIAEDQLLRTAYDHRPDLIATGYLRASWQAQLALAKRQKFPDIALSLTYVQGGYGGVGTSAAVPAPPQVTFGISMPLPVFYQQQGQIRQAEAQEETSALQQAKTTAQVTSDVSSAYAAFVTSRRLVERMQTGNLLQSARVARDITRLQYDKGAASLTDYLLALQSYIATYTEYIGDLAQYWVAVFQLEQAVAADLR